VDEATLEALLVVQPEAWRKEMEDIEEYIAAFDERTPRDLQAELAEVKRRLG
jgi:GTP-dependent phosphoenolpyruvate carboxykinase